MTDTPLIWTTRGNYPVDQLDYTQEWEDGIASIVTIRFEDGTLKPHVDKQGYMKLIERYHFKDTGEIAKESAHVCEFKLPEISVEQGLIG